MPLIQTLRQASESGLKKKEVIFGQKESELQNREINLRSREKNLREQVAKFQSILQSKEDIQNSKEKLLDRIGVLKKEERLLLEKLVERKEQHKSVRLDIDHQVQKFEQNEKKFLDRIDELYRLEKDLLEKEQLLELKEKVLRDKESELVKRERASEYIEAKSQKLARDWNEKIVSLKEESKRLYEKNSAQNSTLKQKEKALNQIEKVIRNKGAILSELKKERDVLGSQRTALNEEAANLHSLKKSIAKRERYLHKKVKKADRHVEHANHLLRKIGEEEKTVEKRIAEKAAALQELDKTYSKEVKQLDGARKTELEINKNQKELVYHREEQQKRTALLDEKERLLKQQEKEFSKKESCFNHNITYKTAETEHLIAKKTAVSDKELAKKSAELKVIEINLDRDAKALAAEKDELNKTKAMLSNYDSKIEYLNKTKEEAVREEKKLESVKDELLKERSSLDAKRSNLRSLAGQQAKKEKELRRAKVKWLGVEDLIKKSKEEFGRIFRSLETAVAEKKAELLNITEMRRSKLQTVDENRSFIKEQLKKINALRERDINMLKSKEAEVIEAAKNYESERRKLMAEEDKITSKIKVYEADASMLTKKESGLTKLKEGLNAHEMEIKKEALKLEKDRETIANEKLKLDEQKDRLKKASIAKKGFVELEAKRDGLQKEIELQREKLAKLSSQISAKQKAVAEAVKPRPLLFRHTKPIVKFQQPANFDVLMADAKKALSEGHLDRAMKLAVELELLCDKIKAQPERRYDVEELKTNIKLASLS